MVYLGAQAFVETLALWQDVVPTEGRVTATGATFIEQALNLVRVRRNQVEAILIPYLRLRQALLTGTTFQDALGETADVRPSLSALRADFVQAVERYAEQALTSADVPDRNPDDTVEDKSVEEDGRGGAYHPYSLDQWLDEGDIDLERIDSLEELLDALEDAFEDEAQAIVENLGPKLLEEKIKDASKDDHLQTAREVEAEREELHRKVGTALAGQSERMVQNGGRRSTLAIGSVNGRVIGFVRIHKPRGDAHPCGFCALLLSRGFVPTNHRWKPGDSLYYSFRGAGGEIGSVDQFHTGCHCRAEEVYSESDIESDPRFDLNRFYAAEYQRVIQGRFSGRDALTAWRKHIRSLDS